MANLEMLEKTKACLEALVNGKNPNDDTEIPEDDKVITLKVVRCLYCAKEAVEIQLEKERKDFKKREKTKYSYLTREQLASFVPKEEKLSLTKVLGVLKECINDPCAKIPSTSAVSKVLVEMGMLKSQQFYGRETKVATEQGKEIGIVSFKMVNFRGVEYLATLYNKEAQQFVVDNVIPVLLEGKE